MGFPVLDEEDVELLMHRDVHFGGNFNIMLEYYAQGGVGVQPDFAPTRICELAHYERALGEDLSEKVLPDIEKEQVERAKEVYIRLRDVYEEKDPLPTSLLISNLILTEEEDPQQEIAALVEHGSEVVPALIHLINADNYYNPLFPGYGRAPLFAARALAKIGDPKAIPHLFNALAHDSLEVEETVFSALRTFGEDAKEFLLAQLQSLPLSNDNERAAMALANFLPNEEISQVAREMLGQSTVNTQEPFASYLQFLVVD